jgi:glycosyltransferase involved in cell wall biosynthesis
MRVSLINVSLRSDDAIGACVLNQVRFFQKRGDDVRVYLTNPAQKVPSDVKPLTGAVALRELIEGRDEHFMLSDLYVYHYPGHYPLVETIRDIERGTVVFYYHNVTPPELWGTDVGREYLVDGVEGAILAHYADLVITPSPFNKQDLVERLGYAPERIYVLPLAVDVNRFSPAEGDPGIARGDPELVKRYGLEGQRVLLFVGRMAGNKRIDLLIDALARIKREVTNTKLLLVGDKESDPAFQPVVAAAQARAKELGVSDDAIWTGRVDDVAPYYRLADVFVTASLHEGFGVPLIEAMASGVPAVACRAGGMPWVMDDAGLLCEPQDALDLAEKTLSLLVDAELRQRLIVRGLERAQEFSLAAYEADLAKILDDVHSGAPAGVPSRHGFRRGSEGRQTVGDEGVSGMLLEMLADAVQARSDVSMREYVVRSGVPLVGPLIAWFRRNLTSHLREPYVDPIIDRQVNFNRRTADWVDGATQLLVAGRRRQEELEARIKDLEAQIARLTQRD